MKFVDKIATRTNEDKTERKVPYRSIDLDQTDLNLGVSFVEMVETVAQKLGIKTKDVIEGWNSGLSLRMNSIANKPWTEVSEKKAQTELRKEVVRLLAGGKTKEAIALAEIIDTDPVTEYKARFQK